VTDLKLSLHVTAEATVIPGPVTLALRGERGEHWCACHGWHRHDTDGALICVQERGA
jgi:hypothetical protein